ncbi:MAG: NrfD/PsrC family molybdoenzyme membrane anchor subunit [Roseiarcus sp.]
MEPLFAAAPFIGYVYPNETVFPWSVLIVVYPYLTGLVAGAFTVSSLYQVFGIKQLRPVAHFALLTSLCCMLFVPTPLLLHLGHPERAFNAVFTPHWSSAMAMFGYFAGFYIILLFIETWFVFRPYMVEQAQARKGLLGLIYRVMCLGCYDVSDKAMSADRKWIFALAILGIPGAHGLHGYVGFIFGSLKSREWWSSDLMPVIFLFSAIISGVSLLIVLYVLSCKLRRVRVDVPCVKAMGYTLWGFVMFTLLLEGVEFGSLMYKAREGIEMIVLFVSTKLIVPFFVLQLTVGALTPILILSFMFWRGTKGPALVAGITLAAMLVLFNVIMMRFNVVIGGQEIAKTGKGLLEFPWEMWGRDGVLAAGSVLVAPMILLALLVRLLPPWEDGPEHGHAAAA